MRVGSSYYNTAQFEVENREFAAISRFGIGILTCFMVSDDIEIITLRRQKGHRIRMTSVQSTYLLRELEVDDPLLSGLDPHGTRVTIRLRATVDLSKRTLEEIVRYWIILPECPVEFSEKGKDSVRIGFASPAEALEHFHRSANKVRRYDIESKTEILSTRRTSTEQAGESEITASYEMAFAVHTATSYIPERSFAGQPEEEFPVVCIEGIRVSNVLPGFASSPHGISALLSVRGSRRFRTTVSREGLEIDAEYENVAKLAAEMLFEHLDHEVARIADRPGRPLSLASTGARWLYEALERSASERHAKPHLAELFNRQPSIVVERVERSSERPRTVRQLMSAEGLRSLPFVWTIESRSVDSLGIISRDLGRELSLNEFLATLAPDITQLSYSPILPDAHEWARALRSSFRPDRVEFSRSHQQSAVHWIPLNPGEPPVGLDVAKLCTPEQLRQLAETMERDRPRGGAFRFDISTAEISGDDAQVAAVVCRVGTMLRADCIFDRLWKAISTRIRSLVSSSGDLRSLVAIARVANSFHDNLTRLARREARYLEPVSRYRHMYMGSDYYWYDDDGPSGTRQELVRHMSEAGLADGLPTDWQSAFKPDAVFDARGSWRSWGILD